MASNPTCALGAPVQARGWPRPQAAGQRQQPSAAFSIVSTPRAKAGAGGMARRRCASLVAVLLVAVALALALGLGVLVGHLAWPRPMAGVAPVQGYHWRPDVVTSMVRKINAKPAG